MRENCTTEQLSSGTMGQPKIDVAPSFRYPVAPFVRYPVIQEDSLGH